MAIEHTDRMGLPTYTSGTDLHPTREDFNERMGLIDQLAAVFRIGTLEDRPLPETPGLLYICTDSRLLYVDTGTEWIDVRRLGHDGAGRALEVGSSEGTEGESDRAARADHTHPLPLATRTTHGAMSSDDKSLIDAASNLSYPNRLVRRDGSGRINTPDPATSANATNKGYVDSHIEQISSAISGQLLNERKSLGNTNLDSVTEPGVYEQDATSNFTSSNGYPETTSVHGTLVVSRATSNARTQLLLSTSISTRAWFRALSHGGTWSPWVEFTEPVPAGTPAYRGGTTTHLDNLTEAGIYEISGSTSGRPGSTDGSVQVTRHESNGSRVVQWYTSYHSNHAYFRTRHEQTGWNDWQRLLTEAV